MAQINSNWTAPTFSFDSADQPTAWRDFYYRATDYLESLRINPKEEDQQKKGWTQIKLMFKGEDRHALQTLIDNDTITEADQRTPTLALKAIQTALKEGEHYWHYRDEVLSDLRQQPNEQVHTLSTRIINLVNNCNFQDQQTTETIKIMLLQHAIRYHEARDWIRQQDPATLTYKSLLQHCKSLEQRCEHFSKAQQKGRAELTSLATAMTTNTIHQDAITTHSSHNTCYRCGYNHPNRECPAIGQRCHNCNGLNHFTALCKSRHTNSYNYNRHSRYSRREHHRSKHSNRSRDSSRSSSRSSSRNRSHNRRTRRQRRSPTPHSIDTITTTQDYTAPNSITDDSSTQFKKCKNRSPTPLPPTNVFSHINYSDTEYPDTASELSIDVHTQDEDQYSTDYNAMSPSRTYFLPITPQKTMLPRPSATLPRPSRIPVPKQSKVTKNQHKSQPTAKQVKSSPKPSRIPVFNNKRHKLTLQVTQPAGQPTIRSLPRPSEETIIKQPRQIRPEPTKSPLLPTPPAHNRQSTTPRSSASNSSRNSTFSRPSTVISRPPPRNNYRFHQNSYISRPHTPEFNTQRPPLLPRPSYQRQNFMTGPYQQHQQTQGHYTQQVSLPPYVPIIILTPYNQINNVLAQQTKLFNPNQQ